jgi:signal transduction histidine kinase
VTARKSFSNLASQGLSARRTIRLRLTAIYGGLFLASGAALLAVTYAYVNKVTSRVESYVGTRGRFTFGFASMSPGGVHGAPSTASPQTKVLMALAARQHAGEMHQFLVYCGVALAVIAALSLALGWFVAGRALRPVRTITATAREISATNLHRRLALAGPNDELRELGDTFDDLLGRLERFVHAQRQFVANASHELRTPLAWQKAIVQVALADPDADSESLRAAHEQVLVSAAQQERLLEALLTLTRGQAGTERSDHIDLAAVAELAVLTRESEAVHRGIELRSRLRAAPTTGDARLVERLVANIVDNAMRYNVPGGHVEVTTGTEAGLATITVANTGPQVRPDQVDRLLMPFERFGPDRTNGREGNGLGLSIVEAISTAHGATLSLRPREAGGLEVAVSFPLSESRDPSTAEHSAGDPAPIDRWRRAQLARLG